MAFIKAIGGSKDYEINTDYIKYATQEGFKVIVTTIDDYTFEVSIKDWNRAKEGE